VLIADDLGVWTVWYDVAQAPFNVQYLVIAGGGGAGAAGNNGLSSVGGNGGDGVASTITGAPVNLAGGGGGAGENTNNGLGGLGGGGNAAQDAVENTGGGGGGATNEGTSGAGGSGVVILRYPSSLTITGGTGLAFTTATDGTDKVTTFTAGSGTIQFQIA